MCNTYMHVFLQIWKPREKKTVTYRAWKMQFTLFHFIILWSTCISLFFEKKPPYQMTHWTHVISPISSATCSLISLGANIRVLFPETSIIVYHSLWQIHKSVVRYYDKTSEFVQHESDIIMVIVGEYFSRNTCDYIIMIIKQYMHFMLMYAIISVKITIQGNITILLNL